MLVATSLNMVNRQKPCIGFSTAAAPVAVVRKYLCFSCIFQITRHAAASFSTLLAKLVFFSCRRFSTPNAQADFFETTGSLTPQFVRLGAAGRTQYESKARVTAISTPVAFFRQLFSAFSLPLRRPLAARITFAANRGVNTAAKAQAGAFTELHTTLVPCTPLFYATLAQPVLSSDLSACGAQPLPATFNHGGSHTTTIS